MKHKVSELSGVELDAAVAIANGEKRIQWRGLRSVFATDDHGIRWEWRYSRDWAHGGPIIDRERIWTGFCDEQSAWPGQWFAQYGDDDPNHHQIGPTLLIAAMRAYVASKLGEEVELP